MLHLESVHKSWKSILTKALGVLDKDYQKQLMDNPHWLPGQNLIFSAFSQPLEKLQYILWGESPYPRPESANGLAFWDAAVTSIWSETGLAKPVNRATSLRNLIKMLLVARGNLTADSVSQPAIACIDKSGLIETLDQLFQNLHNHGFLLLNASLVLSNMPVKKEAKLWQPFMNSLLADLAQLKPDLELVLFGNIAKVIAQMAKPYGFKLFVAEHPYNISFIHNPDVLAFFKPLDLLRA